MSFLRWNENFSQKHISVFSHVFAVKLWKEFTHTHLPDYLYLITAKRPHQIGVFVLFFLKAEQLWREKTEYFKKFDQDMNEAEQLEVK